MRKALKDITERGQRNLREAVSNGDELEVRKALRQWYPFLDVNWNERGTVLHLACLCGYDTIISMLLAHPFIDVNAKDDDGDTPFKTACSQGKVSCVRLLLNDARVRVNEPDNKYGGSPPLSAAAQRGHLDAIKLWIASGRPLDLGKGGGIFADALNTASVGAERGKKGMESDEEYYESIARCRSVLWLLESYNDDPEEAIRDVRESLEITGTVMTSSFFFFLLLLICLFLFPEFPVVKPPKLSLVQYRSLLDGDAILQDQYISVLGGQPVTTSGGCRVSRVSARVSCRSSLHYSCRFTTRQVSPSPCFGLCDHKSRGLLESRGGDLLVLGGFRADLHPFPPW